MSAPGYTIADTAITVGSTSNWSTDTGVVFAIDEAQVVDGQEVQVAGTYNEYIGVVSSGTSVTSVAWQTGVGDRNYASGALTRVYIPVSAERENRIVTWGTTQHNQDGTHAAVTATSVTATGTVQGATVVATGDSQLRSISLETIRSETEFDYVASGGVWSGDAYASTRNASMTALTAYIGGRRGTISAVTARAFTASKDTYIDVLNTAGVFSLVYTEVANNVASPALAANSIRLAIVVTGASNIAAVGSVNQGQEDRILPIASSVAYSVTDSLGNLICPRDPTRKILGYKQVTANQATASVSYVDITGLSCPVIVPAGRKVIVTTFFCGASNSTAGSGGYFNAYDATNSVGVAQSLGRSGAASAEFHVNATRPYTPPTSGSMTFKSQFALITSGAISTNAATGLGAGYIKVELA